MGLKVREKPQGSGVWWIFIDHQGKRKAKKVGDKRTAVAAAKKIEAKLVLGDVGLMEEKEIPPAFSNYAAIWISSTVPATCKPSTLSDYQSILKHHVLPVFGNTPVTEITRLDVKRFLTDKINAGFAASTVNPHEELPLWCPQPGYRR
jgi:integrase